MTTEMIKKESIEEIVAHRDRAIELYEKAHRLMMEANREASLAVISQPVSFEYQARRIAGDHMGSERYGDRFMHRIRQDLDAQVWRQVMEQSGLSTMLNAKKKDAFYNQVSKDAPEVTIENVTATVFELAARSGDMFVESVQDLFKQLSGTFKSHKGFGFGPRIILKRRMDAMGFNYYYHDEIRDLDRVLHILSGLEPPEPYGGLIGAAKEFMMGKSFSSVTPGEIQNDMCRVKWYKNGNVHIWINEDLLIQMNEILRSAHEDELCDRP